MIEELMDYYQLVNSKDIYFILDVEPNILVLLDDIIEYKDKYFQVDTGKLVLIAVKDYTETMIRLKVQIPVPPEYVQQAVKNLIDLNNEIRPLKRRLNLVNKISLDLKIK